MGVSGERFKEGDTKDPEWETSAFSLFLHPTNERPRAFSQHSNVLDNAHGDFLIKVSVNNLGWCQLSSFDLSHPQFERKHGLPSVAAATHLSPWASHEHVQLWLSDLGLKNKVPWLSCFG